MGFLSLFVGPSTMLLNVETPDTRGEFVILAVFAGVGALYLCFAFLRIVTGAQGRSRFQRMRDLVFGVLLVGGPLAVMAGMAPWVTVAAVWIPPVLAFMFDHRFFLPLKRTADEGEGSLLRTEFLDAMLDPDSGMLDGEVIRGRYRGHRLSDLSPDQLDVLIGEASSDPDSISIVTTFLLQFRGDGRQGRERTGEGEGFGRGKRAGAGGGQGGDGAMKVEDAYKVLGLEPGAGEKKILAAHRKLMKLVHPDHGGSNYLASRVNEARDLLLEL